MAVRHCLVLALMTAPAAAQTVSVRDPGRPPVIRPVEAAALLGAIAIAAAFDGTVRRHAQADRTPGRNRAAQFGNAFGNLTYTGPLLAAGWLAGEVAHSPALARASYRALEAAVVAGAITGVIKFGLGRVRPRDGGDPGLFHPFTSNVSFPSGHTTVAMAVATSLALSTPDHWSDVLFYTAAALTGFARINDNQHWLSDVVAAGAIGYLTGRQLNGRRGRFRPLASTGLIGVSATF